MWVCGIPQNWIRYHTISFPSASSLILIACYMFMDRKGRHSNVDHCISSPIFFPLLVNHAFSQRYSLSPEESSPLLMTMIASYCYVASHPKEKIWNDFRMLKFMQCMTFQEEKEKIIMMLMMSFLLRQKKGKWIIILLHAFTKSILRFTQFTFFLSLVLFHLHDQFLQIASFNH